MCGHVVPLAEHLLSNMLPRDADKVVTWGMPGVLVPRLQCYSLLHLFLCVGLWIHWSCQEDTAECKQGNLYVREACRTVWMLFCVSPAGTCRICSTGPMCLHKVQVLSAVSVSTHGCDVSTRVIMGSALNGPRCVNWVQIPWLSHRLAKKNKTKQKRERCSQPLNKEMLNSKQCAALQVLVYTCCRVWTWFLSHLKWMLRDERSGLVQGVASTIASPISLLTSALASTKDALCLFHRVSSVLCGSI